jgi:release factor glutamine methyltransferase
LLCEACGLKSRAEIFLKSGRLLVHSETAFVEKCLKQRKKKYPLAYIFGKAHFYGLEFEVTPDTLIPRQETELLVEECLRHRARNILDAGCGCGNISITLALTLNDVFITAIDVSAAALEIAARNAQRHGINGKISFVKTDVFTDGFVSALGGKKFDIIVSNPPYVAADEYPSLQKEILFEPRAALDGGPGGLSFYVKLAGLAGSLLEKGGFLVTEIGYGRSDAVRDIYTGAGLTVTNILKDYSGIDRVVTATRS